MKRVLLIMFCAMFSLAGMAQNLRTVKGVVMNVNEEPLSGVTVKALNSDAVTVTDVSGRFELKVSPDVKYVEASSENYITGKVEIDGSYIVFNLKPGKQFKAKTKAETKVKRAAEKRVLKAERKVKYLKHINCYNSIVETSLFSSYDSWESRVGVNYIGGYRFNNYLFVGAGVGAEMPLGNYIWLDRKSYLTRGVTFPVFAHIRANFLNRRWSPFFALSAGARFMIPQLISIANNPSNYEYDYISAFVNPQFGVNFRATSRTSVYLSVGANGYSEEELSIMNPYQVLCKPRFSFGFNLHLGVTF